MGGIHKEGSGPEGGRKKRRKLSSIKVRGKWGVHPYRDG